MADFSRDLAGTDDESIRAAVAEGEVPALLPALAAATGDLGLVPDHLRPGPAFLMDPTGGLGFDQLAEGRERAVAAIIRLRDEGAVTGPLPPAPAAPALLERLLSFVAGGGPVADYVDLLREELALGEDLRAPAWTVAGIDPDRRVRAVVVGAGMSGLLAAHRLLQAGVEVTVVEKNPDVGGTWWENSYPGCRVDVSNHFYSYSFAPRPDWPENYSSQPVLLDYFRRFADASGVRPHIRFGTEVHSATLDETTMTWTVEVGPSGAAGGPTGSIEADLVVSAVGQLNRPNIPDIAGADSFAGPSFHSSRWDHSVDLTGLRVAVIGTGASAAQLIPEVAATAGSVTVFQRTPAWFVPTPDYRTPVSDGARWLFANVPGYANWYRFWIFWRNVEGLVPAATVDPEWSDDGSGRAVSAMNDLLRQMLTAYLEAEFASHPDLLASAVPDYPPFAKRFIRDDGAWARTLRADHVDLVTQPIAGITASGVRTADGTEHEADVIVYGTGFAASDFLVPMKVVGREGVDLHERWGGDARAHLGITLPGFPNLFLLYGPNTNIVANGSITYFSECEVRYVGECIRLLLTTGARALEPTEEAHDAYNAWIDEGNEARAWGVSTVNSWYRNATGRSAQNWPFSLLEYWQRTRTVDRAEHLLHP